MAATAPSAISWISHPLCLRHEMEPGHPESPARLAAIERRIGGDGLESQITRIEAPEAPPERTDLMVPTSQSR